MDHAAPSRSCPRRARCPHRPPASGPWALLLTAGLFLASFALLAAPAAAVTVGSGVRFQPSASWSDVSFGAEQSFSIVEVDPTGVLFGTVRFGVVKAPSALPRANLVIGTWSPYQTTANQTAIAFTADLPAGSTLSFAFSGMIPIHEYVLQVDGGETSRSLANRTGFVAFAWSGSGTHGFGILLGWRIGSPPPRPAVSAAYAFAPGDPGAGQVVAFAAAASGGYAPYAFDWRFGNDGTASGANATHAFSTAGNYTTTLTVTDLSGVSAVVSQIVRVQSSPAPSTLAVGAAFAPAAPHVADAVAFSSAVFGGSPPYGFAWAFGDGGSGTTPSPVHAYVAVGTYVASLTVQDRSSSTARATLYVNVSEAPASTPGNVTASFDYRVDGTTVTFVDRSTSDVGLPITTRFWSFGDGTASSDPGPVHVYGLPGLLASYTVILVACDSEGHCGTTSQVVTLVNWSLLILVVLVVAAIIGTVLVVVWRRRRKRADEATKVRGGRRPPTD